MLCEVISMFLKMPANCCTNSIMLASNLAQYIMSLTNQILPCVWFLMKFIVNFHFFFGYKFVICLRTFFSFAFWIIKIYGFFSLLNGTIDYLVYFGNIEEFRLYGSNFFFLTVKSLSHFH